MADVSIGINPTTFQNLMASMNGYKGYLSQLTAELLKQEAALSARAFIKYSPPIPYGGGNGGTGKAKKQGEIAVERDIRSVIVPRDSSLAASVDSTYGSIDSFQKWKRKRLKGKVGTIIEAIHSDNNIERAYRAAKNLMGKSPAGDRLLSSQATLRRAHETQRRMYRGRITRNRGPSADVKREHYFAEAVDIDAYIKKRQDMVGRMSSGWWAVIKQIGQVRLNGGLVNSGAKDVPMWIKKHSGTPAYVTKSNLGSLGTIGGPGNASITIVNLIGDADGAATSAGTKAAVIRSRINAIASRPYDRELANGIRQFNSGARQPRI